MMIIQLVMIIYRGLEIRPFLRFTTSSITRPTIEDNGTRAYRTAEVSASSKMGRTIRANFNRERRRMKMGT